MKNMSDARSVSTQRASDPEGTVEVIVKHQGIESRILGTPNGVIRELLSYFSKVYPSLELTSTILLSVDNNEFLQVSSGILAATPEGPALLKDTSQVKDKELIMLHLAGSRLMHLLSRKESDAILLDELTKATGKSTGTIAGRLSELCDEQLAERVGKGSYRLTTMGTRTFVKTLAPKLAAFPDR